VSDSAPEVPDEPSATAAPTRSPAAGRRPTRVSAAWIATGVGLVLLLLLLTFILQNPQGVRIHFPWLDGSMPLGVALFGASVIGGVVVAIAGASRIVQLRRSARRARKGLRSSDPEDR
jgi:uncharacterized integral membrane protein